MPYHFEPGNTVTVYILENNHLAAQYLLNVLTHDSKINAKIIHDFGCSASGSPCILLMDQVTFLRCAQKLRILYPVARVLLIGHGDGKKHLLAHTPHEVAAFIPYSEIATSLVITLKKIWGQYSGAISDSVGAISMSSPAYYQLCQKLTKRELAVVELMKHRLSNKEIATVLDISEATVKFHVTNIFAKTKVSRRRELFSIFQEIVSVEGSRLAS